jgi:hypothetical protein
MVKRSIADLTTGHMLVSPGLKDAPVLDLMCSHFVLTLAARQGAGFNARRDLNGVVALAGRHLVWPAPVLARVRDFLARRCTSNELWRDHEALAPQDFLARFGVWRGLYEEGTLFFYLDEYAKEQPRDLIAVLAATGDWLSHVLKKQSTLVEKHRCPGWFAAAEQGRAGLAAVRHAGALPARLAQHPGGVQGQQRARGLCGDCRGGGRECRRRR